jgi:hypothetical protein
VRCDGGEHGGPMKPRTLCQDHNGIVHVRTRASACPPNDAYTLCGRDMRVSSTWVAGAPGAPALVTCTRCLTEANTKPPKPYTGELFDAVERKEN